MSLYRCLFIPVRQTKGSAQLVVGYISAWLAVVGYISASVAYNQVSRGVDPKIAILVVSICGLESKTYAVLRRATQHVLLQSSGSANFGALQQFCVKLRPPAPVLQAAPIQCNQSDQQFANKQVPTGIRVYDRRVLFFLCCKCAYCFHSLTQRAICGRRRLATTRQ